MTPETAIFEGLETLLRLARDARAGGGEQDLVAVVGSVVGVFVWGATPVWSRAGTGKGRFEEETLRPRNLKAPAVPGINSPP